MLNLTISDWIRRINKQLESGLFTDVLINHNKKTKELTNFEFCLIPEELEDYDLVPPPNKEEIEERHFIITRSSEVYEIYLKSDILSRQAAFVNNYDLADNHCISYFHHYVRDNKYCVNVYVRSMNYLDNFIYDCQTFNLAYKFTFEKIKEKYPSVCKGFIRVFAFSLHVYQ